MQKNLRGIYREIYNSISSLIPEKWEKICLYASCMQTIKGEIYFYYIPKKLIKAKPINCYEIASKFGLDDSTYNGELSKLYMQIKKLKQSLRVNFSNVTIVIDKKYFTMELHYNDLRNSRYSDKERHIIWDYKYLGLPIDSLSRKEQNLISHYREETNINPTIIVEEISNLEKEDIKNPILKV